MEPILTLREALELARDYIEEEWNDDGLRRSQLLHRIKVALEFDELLSNETEEV